MNPAPATILSRLAGIVSKEHVIADAAQLTPYEVDGLRPSAAVQPGTAEEVAEAVRFAVTEKLALLPCGARTKLGMGMPPQRYDVALDLTRMNRIVAYDPGDLTLGVEAGMPLAELAAQLEHHRQMIPLAVPFTNRTTVGGTIASGVDSPLRQLYGTPRDYILGIEFVNGEGKLCKSGGRVVKNVAGYDLHKLMIGSLGTLGVLTRVNFRTFPLPRASRGFLAAFPTFDGALELRKRIVQSPVQPMTLEIISPALARILAERTPSTLGKDLAPVGDLLSASQWTVAAAYGGNEAVLGRCEKELTRMAEESRAARVNVLGDDTRPLVWGRLRECIPMMLESSPLATLFRITALPSQLARVVGVLQHAPERSELPFVALVRGAGVVYLALLPAESRPETVERIADLSARIFDISASLAEHAVIQWCPTKMKRHVNVWGPPLGDLELMMKLKDVFDPQRVLSPGRFVGGI